jgi:hypothetical protein
MWREKRAAFDKRLVEIATIFHNRKRNSYKEILGTTINCDNIDKYKCATVSFRTELEDGKIILASFTFLYDYYYLSDDEVMGIDDSKIIYREKMEQ